MKKGTKIAVAMSGGVDSSVAAALLAGEYGKENVFGVTMRLFCYSDKETGPKSCCSLAAINDAKAVAKKLGIKHYVLDFEKEFEKEVIDDFVSEYIKGRTPNPCIRCNTIIKFDYLYKKARALGAEKIATGHYARIREIKSEKLKVKSGGDYSSSGVEKYHLLRGLDDKKDQSYFLYGITQNQLKHTLFPLGGMKKTEVRKLAKKYGLKTAEKTESQEICFIAGDTDYHGFISTRKNTDKIREGDIVDKKGNILGRHKGLPFYTIGQRKGIGIARKEPYYVLGFNIKKNQLVVGDEKDLYRKEFVVKNVNWILGKSPGKGFKAYVMIRYNMEPQKAIIYPSNGVRSSKTNSSHLYSNNNVRVVFNKPQKSITPGQSAVFYSKDEVLGGGIIERLSNSK